MRKLLVLAVLLAACSGASYEDASFVLFDGSIAGPDHLDSSDSLAIGVENHGDLNHTLVVTDSEGKVVAATDLIAPGESEQLEIGLSAGTYMVSCRIVAEDDEGNLFDHYELGMYRTVVVHP